MAQRAYAHGLLFTTDRSMTLPLAVVSRWPGEEYQKQHTDMASALKHNVGDALKLYRKFFET